MKYRSPILILIMTPVAFFGLAFGLYELYETNLFDETIKSIPVRLLNSSQIAFSTNEKSWAYLDNDENILTIRTINNGKWVTQTFEKKEIYNLKTYSLVSFSPDGKILAYNDGNYNEIINILMLNNDSEWNLIQTICNDSEWNLIQTICLDDICSISFSLDGKTMACEFYQNTVTAIWVMNNNGQFDFAQNLNHKKDNHLAFFYLYSRFRFTIFSPCNRIIAVIGDNCKVKIYNLNSENQWHCTQILFKDEKIYSCDYEEACFSPDGKILAISFDHGNIEIWSLNKDLWKKTQLLENDNDSSIVKMIFSPKGDTIVSLLTNNTIKILKLNYNGQWDCVENITQQLELEEVICSISFYYDKNVLMAKSSNGLMTMWRDNLDFGAQKIKKAKSLSTNCIDDSSNNHDANKKRKNYKRFCNVI